MIINGYAEVSRVLQAIFGKKHSAIMEVLAPFLSMYGMPCSMYYNPRDGKGLCRCFPHEHGLYIREITAQVVIADGMLKPTLHIRDWEGRFHSVSAGVIIKFSGEVKIVPISQGGKNAGA